VKYAFSQTKQFGIKKNGVADVWNWKGTYQVMICK
jgi:hypothetical protein